MKKLVMVLMAIMVMASWASAQSGHSVALSWVASTTPSVSYRVFRSTVSGGPYSQISGNVSALTFTDSIVSNGATYFYVVRSFDGTVESADSNEVKAVIPQAPQPPGQVTATVK